MANLWSVKDIAGFMHGIGLALFEEHNQEEKLGSQNVKAAREITFCL
jgi:hypothetical protein